MANYKKPIFETRVEKFPQDKIRPYGERIGVYSEAKRKAVRHRLLSIKKPKN